MTRIQKLMGIAAMALMVAGGMGVAVKATRSPFAVTKLANASSQPCAEGTFEWRWNVPGSACEAKADVN
jgi:hypothetical protein